MNMTELTNDEIMGEIKKGAKELNDMLELGLTEDTYIKTRGYKNYKAMGKKLKKKLPVDPENMKRKENSQWYLLVGSSKKDTSCTCSGRVSKEECKSKCTT